MLRALLKDDSKFIQLVLKVVALNEDNHQEEYYNVLLLDKVNQHEQVIKYLIKLQRQEIERNSPQYFILANQGRENYIEHLREIKTPIVQVIHEKAQLLNHYEKQGYKKKYHEHYHILQILDAIASAFNKIWDQKYEEALIDLSTLDLLPMKK